MFYFYPIHLRCVYSVGYPCLFVPFLFCFFVFPFFPLNSVRVLLWLSCYLCLPVSSALWYVLTCIVLTCVVSCCLSVLLLYIFHRLSSLLVIDCHMFKYFHIFLHLLLYFFCCVSFLAYLFLFHMKGIRLLRIRIGLTKYAPLCDKQLRLWVVCVCMCAQACTFTWYVLHVLCVSEPAPKKMLKANCHELPWKRPSMIALVAKSRVNTVKADPKMHSVAISHICAGTMHLTMLTFPGSLSRGTTWLGRARAHRPTIVGINGLKNRCDIQRLLAMSAAKVQLITLAKSQGMPIAVPHIVWSGGQGCH